MIPVMLLINRSPLILLKTNGYAGLNSIKFVLQYPIDYPYSEVKMAFIIPELFFQGSSFIETFLGH